MTLGIYWHLYWQDLQYSYWDPNGNFFSYSQLGHKDAGLEWNSQVQGITKFEELHIHTTCCTPTQRLQYNATPEPAVPGKESGEEEGEEWGPQRSPKGAKEPPKPPFHNHPRAPINLQLVQPRSHRQTGSMKPVAIQGTSTNQYRPAGMLLPPLGLLLSLPPPRPSLQLKLTPPLLSLLPNLPLPRPSPQPNIPRSEIHKWYWRKRNFSGSPQAQTCPRSPMNFKSLVRKKLCSQLLGAPNSEAGNAWAKGAPKGIWVSKLKHSKVVKGVNIS